MTQQAPENEKKKRFSWFSKKPKSEPKLDSQEQSESQADTVAPSEVVPELSPDASPEASPETQPEQPEPIIPDETSTEQLLPTVQATADIANESEAELLTVDTEVQQSETDETNSPGFFQRLKVGLKNTREQLSGGLGNLFLGKKEIDDDLLEELETYLLMADVGVEATQHIIATLTDAVSRKELNDPQALLRALKTEMTAMLSEVAKPLEIPQQDT
ncbi:MAG: signal recognition particle receptor subunit alpha, partial [Gammaproteobacteria bacterium]|nr:signal recognition particle receptor subunit alpha [Gammaproteobacteria bacterium]